MNHIKYLTILLLGLVLSACGGGGNNSLTGGGQQGGASEAAVLTLIQNSGQLQSASNIPVEITAIVTDERGGAVPEALVTFSANGDAGSRLSPGSAVQTDENGLAQVRLTTTNPDNRNITITASSGNALSSSVAVSVVGSQVEVTGPSSIGLDQTGGFTVFVSDSEGAALGGQNVAITSANGNTITAPTLVTGPQGRVDFDVTIDGSGDDQITVTSAGATVVSTIIVLADNFEITAPAPGGLVPLGTPTNVTLRWQQNGANVVGDPVTFSATRGLFNGGASSVASAVTNGAGEATVTVSSDDSGVSTLSVTDVASGISTSIQVEFVATQAAAVKVEPALANIITGQSTTVEATVTDPNMNPVKNKLVTFQVQDITGGGVSPGSAITDSNGIARTTYTAGDTTNNNVVLTASVVEGGVVVLQDSVTLTVAGQEFSFDIGTGNEIEELSQTIYGKEWSIVVTDGNENPVANSQIQVSAPAIDYRKGIYVWTGDFWVPDYSAICPAEDVNGNGVNDPGEDINGNGRLEPPNVVSIAPIPADAPLNAGCGAAEDPQGSTTTVETNALGIARVCVVYNQDKANWAQVDITASAGVSGSESRQSQSWVLAVSADDVDDEGVSPPGNPSPYGESDFCTDDL